MERAENIAELARRLGVQRELLDLWQAKYRAQGAAGLRPRGRPSIAQPPAETPDDGVVQRDPAARVAELERKIGQQALELDFFRAALQRVRVARR